MKRGRHLRPNQAPYRRAGQTSSKAKVPEPPEWPLFDGDFFNYDSFSSRLSAVISALEGELSQLSLVSLIGKNCLPESMSENLCSEYLRGELECPLTVDQFMGQILDYVRSPSRAYHAVLWRISRWKEVEFGDESAELVLITDFLNLYELCVYYGADDAFLRFDVLERFAPKVPLELLDEMQNIIGNDVDDDVVPARVVEFLKVRKKHLLDGQAGREVKVKERKQQRTQEQDERDRIIAGRITREMSIGNRPVAPRLSVLLEGDQKKDVVSLQNCTKFQNLSVPKRWGVCRREGRCYSCLSTGHYTRDCRKGEGQVNTLLAPPQEPFKSKPISAGCISSAVAGTGSPVMVPAQVVLSKEGLHHNVMFDTGSQITLITRECVRALDAREIGESTLVILGIGNGQSRPYKLVEVSMMDANDKLCQFRAHSVDELKIEVARYDEAKLKIIFPVLANSELRQPQGNIHILIGSDNAQLMPKEKCRNNKLILYESVLKGCSQFVIAGQAVEAFNPVSQPQPFLILIQPIS